MRVLEVSVSGSSGAAALLEPGRKGMAPTAGPQVLSARGVLLPALTRRRSRSAAILRDARFRLSPHPLRPGLSRFGARSACRVRRVLGLTRTGRLGPNTLEDTQRHAGRQGDPVGLRPGEASGSASAVTSSTWAPRSGCATLARAIGLDSRALGLSCGIAAAKVRARGLGLPRSRHASHGR